MGRLTVTNDRHPIEGETKESGEIISIKEADPLILIPMSGNRHTSLDTINDGQLQVHDTPSRRRSDYTTTPILRDSSMNLDSEVLN
jgi:hypothetical protein